VGMYLALHSVSDSNIQNILNEPALIWRLIAPDDPDTYLEEIASNTNKGFFSSLFNKNDNSTSTEVPDLEFIQGENEEDDLDKSWQGIHYCINKSEYEAEPPMDFITLGGETSGDIDVGYGPARFFRNDVVKKIDSI